MLAGKDHRSAVSGTKEKITHVMPFMFRGNGIRFGDVFNCVRWTDSAHGAGWVGG